MRKSLAIILAAVMMLSLAIVGVSAAEPEVITTAEQFAAMAADGNYKLGNDIAIAATYETTFTGTLDGAGYKITVSAPIFARLAGTVKNLVIEGSVSATGDGNHCAPLALRGEGTVVLNNILNKATVATEYRGAGIISQIDNGATATITNCTNEGTITHTGTVSAMIGGIIAYQQGNTPVLKNCLNKGKISSEAGLAGGIIGRFGGDYTKAKEYTCTIENCVNDGEISGGSTVGGIAGFARSCTMYIINCTNNGAVKSTGGDAAGILSASNVVDLSDKGGLKNTGNSDIRIDKCVNNGAVTTDKGRGAGICAYVWSGGGANDVVTSTEVTNCVNYGAIKGTTYVSQIMSYTNKKENVVKNNVGLGSVAPTTADASPKLAFYAFSSAQLPPELKDNIIVADGTEYATWTTETGKSGKDQSRTIPIGGSTEKVEGETTIVFKAEDYVSVKTVDEAKAAVTALGKIGASGAIGYKAPSTPSEGGATGDTAIIVMIVCAVSLLGMGIALKARKA